MDEERSADNSRRATTSGSVTEGRENRDGRNGRTTPSNATGAVPTAPALSLPKGGGAIRGIDEKFSTNLVTGTASFAIPIAASHGRSGSALDLGLSYDSGAGNGPFGLGWRASVLAITRKTDKGLPRYIDAEESDVFVLSGSEDLVPLETEPVPREGYRIQRYRPRVEGLFARIERWTNETTRDSHFRIVSRDNATSIYGRSEGARIADPAAPSRVFSWLLEETRDDRGNAVRYTYKAEDSAGVDPTKTSEVRRFEPAPGAPRFLATAQRYLKRIQYGNRAPLADHEFAPADPSAWLFEVVFDYGEHDTVAPTPDDAQPRPWRLRADPLSSFRAGFEVRTYRLCRRVLMFHRFAELGGTPCLVRSTDFTYDENPALTYLTKVEQAGYVRRADGSYTRAALPPVELDYARLTELDDTLQILDRASLDGIPEGVGGGTTQWIDLNGEGIPGVLRAGERGWYYKANLGDGRLAQPALLGSLPVPAELSGGFQQFVDLQGDGRLELVRYAQPLAGYFTRTTDGSWEPFAALRTVPSIDWGDANLRTLDLDGDGFPDVLITEHDAFVWYRSLATDGFEPARRVGRILDEENGPALVFADVTESIYLADMTGDGLVDIVRVRNGDVSYWPNLGYGHFGPKVTMDGGPAFDRGDRFDPRRIRFADVDGSGTSDVLYLGRDGVAIYLNRAGNSLSEPQVIRSLPVVDTLAGTTVTDLRGRGTSCLVWSSPAPASANQPVVYVDLMNGVKPHLLISIKNNLGAETRIDHASSTQFYLADKAAGTPWITRLPFPVHVVERVTTYDRISRNRFVTRYTYHHGYFDGVEREFRGFGRVDQLDTEELGALTASGDFPAADNIDAASYVPPVLTRTWFHTGAFVDKDRISTQFEQEYHVEPGLADEQRRAMLLDDTVLPDGLSADDMREACRALKGSILRREVYALDGTEPQGRPYLASERNYTIVLVQSRGDHKYGVFFVHPREAIEFHYERKLYDVGGAKLADPRVTHALTLEVDDFGNVLRSVAVGYGRRHDSSDPELTAADREQQRQLKITCTENAYTNAIDQDDAYRTPLPCEGRTYEITKLSPGVDLPDVTNLFGFDEMLHAIDGLEDGAHDLAYEDLAGAGATQAHPYRRRVEHTRTLYRRDDLTGPLPFHHLESRALPYESYKLALTPGLITSVYGDRVTDAMLASEGGYVHSEGDVNWWIPSGRLFYSPGKDDTAAQELAYATQHFFLPCHFLDPFGHTTAVTYDSYDLLALQTRDAVDNLVTIGARDATGAIVDNGNDYRVLQPARVMDPNRNRRAVAFDALGMVVGTAVMGKPEEHLGDSLDGFQADLPDSAIAAHLADPLADPHSLLQRATTRLVYDLFAYQRTAADPRPQALVVYTLARETHDADLAPGQKTKVQHSFSYSDGFGSEIQKKMQAEPGPLVPGGPEISPRWVGSGWTIFNNKGKPVRTYEPFFTDTHRFESAKIHGVSSVLFYDPAGRVVATLHPDHTYEKVVFDPWLQASWDVNDTVLQLAPKADPDVGDFFARLPEDEYLPTWYDRRSNGALGANEKAAADKAAVHTGTPSVVHFDALGRQFLTVAHNRFKRADIVIEEKYRTTLILDIEGNQRAVIDAKDRAVMRYDYELLSNRIHQASMEAGERWMLGDAVSKPIRAWDSRGFLRRLTYDQLRRPTGLYVTENEAERLAERTVYGESQGDTANHRAQVYQRFDAAGVITSVGYDFKDNLRESRRDLLPNYKVAVNWLQNPATTDGSFTSSTTYDALDRPLVVTSPDSSVYQPTFNEANLLNKVEVRLRGAAAATPFVTNIDYDAKGQRAQIGYGNGATSTYEYDPLRFRLTRLTTSRLANPDATISQLFRDASIVQDLHYTYDPVGNIVRIQDAALNTIIHDGQKVESIGGYTYDAVYRLVEAQGREHIGQTDFDFTPVNGDYHDYPFVGNQAHPNDLQALRNYTERYEYDTVGNFEALSHQANGTGWTRRYDYQEVSLLETGKQSNRLTRTQVGNGVVHIEPYTHDAHGNMTSMSHLASMAWDFKDELQRVDLGGGGTAYYIYDGTGRRVRKVLETQNGTRRKERLFLGEFEIYREYNADGSGVALERESLQIMDNKRHIALVDTLIIRDGITIDLPVSLQRYQFANHLQCISIELDNNGALISLEEYHPFGTTSFQVNRSTDETSLKRYRYTGKERDEETGLYCHDARYYAPWFGRWTSCDPAEMIDGPNLFRYCRNSPVVLQDPNGCDPDPSSYQDRSIRLDLHHDSSAGSVSYHLAIELQNPSTGERFLYDSSGDVAGLRSIHQELLGNSGFAAILTGQEREGLFSSLESFAQSVGPVPTPVPNAGPVPEREVRAEVRPEGEVQRRPVDRALGAIADAAKGIEADRVLPQRYRLEPPRGATVTGIRDTLGGRVRGTPPRPVGAPVIRVDQAHPGTPYPHVNIESLGRADPHVQISPRTLAALGGTARTLETIGRVARPIAIATDALRLGIAIHEDQGLGSNTARTAASVAGGWAGAAAGAWAGAKGGAVLGGAIGSVIPGLGTAAGAAFGGLIGGLIGGIGGAYLGSWGAERAAERALR
jgi:RHS repeat-associated protein